MDVCSQSEVFETKSIMQPFSMYFESKEFHESGSFNLLCYSDAADLEGEIIVCAC